MKHKKIFLLTILSLLALINFHAQGQIIRYKGASSKLWTATQVDSIVLANNEKVRGVRTVFIKQIKNTITRSDTVIHEFALQGANACVRENQKKYAAFIGKPLPMFTMPDLNGNQLSFNNLLGKPVVINLWFTSCAPCIAEMPALNRIQAEKAKTEVIFLALTYESKNKVYTFLKKHPFTFRHVADATQYCALFTKSYPLSIFVGRDGIVKNILEGMPTIYDSGTQKLSGAVDDKDFYAALKQIE